MSFSKEVKEELSKLNTLANKKQVKAELLGYLISTNASFFNGEIKYSTESEYNINRFAKLLNNLSILDYEIEFSGKSFIITFTEKNIKGFKERSQEEVWLKSLEDDDFKALVRGAFLGAGSINNPDNNYHLEIAFLNKEIAKIIETKLQDVGINVKMLLNEKGCDLYIKDGEEISKFLAFIGANVAVLKFEEVRVKRDMSNKINRIVNCEAANLNKTMNAAIRQIEAIEYLQRNKKFDKLEEPLKEIARVRLENPDLPLSELGKKLKKPLGKSGVNYRLNKIIEIADLK